MKPLVLILLATSFAVRAEFDPATSPFADKPCDSYANHRDASGNPAVLRWGDAPFGDFGSRAVSFDPSGVRKLRQSPPAGVHPRIFFGPDDLADVRKRVRETRCGQEAWKNILSWTEMAKGRYDDTLDYAQPDRWKGGFGGLRGRVPLFRLGIPRESGKSPYNKNVTAAATYQSLVDGSAKEFPAYYWNTLALEAFRCLIDEDRAGAKAAGAAVVTMMKIDQVKRAADPKQQGKTPSQPVGAFQLAFAYDFLFNDLSPDQRKLIHAELAETTWSHDNYGTFNTAESSRSNWATFSYWLIQVLAIEGEPGFNELKVRGMYRGWRNLLTYGWFESGATFEGEAKNQLGMDGVIAFATRRSAYGFEDLCGHPYLRAYATKFLPHSVNPMLSGFHKYDLLGGSRATSAGAAPADTVGLKFMFPDDKAIDWIYRKSVGEDYANVPERPDGYFNALLFFAIFASDFDPANNDPAKLALGDTFFCGERALMMTRSSWDKEAMMLNMHTRQANGGHPFSDRNAIMVAGAGRIWSPNGYATFRTAENSVVGIDGKNQNETVPARCVDFTQTPEATFMVGDAKYTWDWDWKRLEKNGGYYTVADVEAGKVAIPAGWEPVMHSVNDFAFKKLPHAYLDWPHIRYGHWLQPKGALSPYVRKPLFPVEKAIRTAGLVRGVQPYAVVIDDIAVDASVHRYDWTLALEHDIQIAGVEKQTDGSLDVLLTGFDPDQTQARAKDTLPSSIAAGTTIPTGQPMLLVKVLNALSGADLLPVIVELPNGADAKKYGLSRRLVISSESVTPDFKVLLIPYRQGASVPRIDWDREKSTATVRSAGTTDALVFSRAGTGKTNLIIQRQSGTSPAKEILRMDRPVPPLADPLAEKRAKEIADTKAWVKNELAGFSQKSLEGLAAIWSFDDFQDEKTSGTESLACPGASLVPGRVGMALKFSGSKEGIALPVDLSNFATNGFTVAFWAKDPEKKGGYFFNNNGNRGISLGLENGTLRIDTDSKHRWHKSAPLTDEWQQVAWTYDGKTMRLYLGGKEIATSEVSAPLQFGKNTVIAPNFTGLLDELALFQRPLSPDEIARIYAVQTYGPGTREP
ncbi:LamG domain-containing protein [bacterium]|nr:LamG domain-containing protein [bacterium]